MRLENVALAVESDALFGADRRRRQDRDPLSASGAGKKRGDRPEADARNARRSIDKALSDFRLQNDDIKVDATMTGLRLVGIEFDSKIVRITAEADGIARVALNKLPVK